MKINYIAKKCWCGEVKTSSFYQGNWYGYGQSYYTKLGKCLTCNTIRTLYCSSKSDLEYSDTKIYDSLSLRQTNSLKTLINYLQPSNLIEIGCGNGILLNEIKKIKNIDVYGIDLNEKSVKSKIYKNIRIEYKKLGEVIETFDNFLALHVLEHIPDLKTFFKEMQTILNDGAVVYITSPNILSFNAKKNIARWGGLNPTQHTWHLSKKTFSMLAKYFLPNSEIKYLKTSWIWPSHYVPKQQIKSILFQGDQFEAIIKYKK